MVSAWTIGSGKRSTDNKTNSAYVPGPGQYDPRNSQKQHLPQWRIGTAKRERSYDNKTPGPGTYTPPVSLKVGPKISMSSKNGSTSNLGFTPGPGAYNPQSLMNKTAPQWSLVSRTSTVEDQVKVPGPGTYNSKSNILERPASKFGTAYRKGIYENSDTPGPGNYNITKEIGEIGPKSFFGTGPKDWQQNSLSKQTPGPGTYESRSAIETNQGFSIVPKRPDTAMSYSQKNPGPGTYNPDRLRPQSGIRIGSATRSQLNKEQVLVPGPGAYEPKASATQISKSVRIGSAHRKPLTLYEEIPGPGTYDLGTSIGTGQKVGIKTRKEDTSIKQLMQTPGPGAYDPEIHYTRQSAGRTRVGTASRDRENYKNNDLPGPGQYDTRGKIDGPKWGFGSGQKGSDYSRRDEPGPGAYNPPSTFADVPKYLIQDAPSKKYL